mmetsp:Transcript_2278/g.5707  ORF Transcript_2278/g.5707 Transcript_2278/m.5707 type:complete len:204 (-) Transcript_2278:943-1554(-)
MSLSFRDSASSHELLISEPPPGVSGERTTAAGEVGICGSSGIETSIPEVPNWEPVTGILEPLSFGSSAFSSAIPAPLATGAVSGISLANTPSGSPPHTSASAFFLAGNSLLATFAHRPLAPDGLSFGSCTFSSLGGFSTPPAPWSSGSSTSSTLGGASNWPLNVMPLLPALLELDEPALNHGREACLGEPPLRGEPGNKLEAS